MACSIPLTHVRGRAFGPYSRHVSDAGKFETGIKELMRDGRVTYYKDWNDGTDNAFVTNNLQKIQQLQEGTPKFSANYTDYVRGILCIMTDLPWSKDVPLKQRKIVAEEESVKLRNLTRHLRREWYTSSKQTYIKILQRPLTTTHRKIRKRHTRTPTRY